MIRPITAFFVGFVFAVGLAIAGMTIPDKILDFLDVAGDWDPSLALVMLGAVGVYSLAYRLSRRMPRPLAAPLFSPPPAAPIDARLIAGALLFGIGWGLAGFCPGPALVSAATGAGQVLAFCAAMIAGFWGTRAIEARLQRPLEGTDG